MSTSGSQCEATRSRFIPNRLPAFDGTAEVAPSAASPATVGAMDSLVSQLEAEVPGAKIAMESRKNKLAQQKSQLLDHLNLEFTKHKLMMNEIAEGAKQEFGRSRPA